MFCADRSCVNNWFKKSVSVKRQKKQVRKKRKEGILRSTLVERGGWHIFKAAMLAPHRALQLYAHFIRTVRSLQSASYYGVTSSSSSSFVRESDCHRRHLLRNSPSIEQLAKTLGSSFATMAKIKVNTNELIVCSKMTASSGMFKREGEGI